jgi:hypothetical protein
MNGKLDTPSTTMYIHANSPLVHTTTSASLVASAKSSKASNSLTPRPYAAKAPKNGGIPPHIAKFHCPPARAVMSTITSATSTHAQGLRRNSKRSTALADSASSWPLCFPLRQQALSDTTSGATGTASLAVSGWANRAVPLTARVRGSNIPLLLSQALWLSLRRYLCSSAAYTGWLRAAWAVGPIVGGRSLVGVRSREVEAITPLWIPMRGSYWVTKVTRMYELGVADVA